MCILGYKCVAQLHGQQTAAVLFSLKIVCFDNMFYATFTIYSLLICVEYRCLENLLSMEPTVHGAALLIFFYVTELF